MAAKLVLENNKELLVNSDKLLKLEENHYEKVLNSNGVTIQACQDILQRLYEWYDKQAHLPKGQLGDRLIMIFLINNGFNLEKVKEKIDNYFTARNKMPEILKNRDPLSPPLAKCLNDSFWVVLPKKTPENHRVTIFRRSESTTNVRPGRHRLRNLNQPKPCNRTNTIGIKKTDNQHDSCEGLNNNNKEYANYCPDGQLIKSALDITATDLLKVSYMIADYRLWNDVMEGEQWIIDFQNSSFQFALQWSPLLISKVSFYLTACLSPKLKGLHLVNMPAYAETGLNLFKKTMKAKLLKRIHVHKDFEDVMKMLPKNIFPSDFGGEEIDSQEICDNWTATLQSTAWRKWFIEQEDVYTDETKREVPTKLDDIFGAEGTFRKLVID